MIHGTAHTYGDNVDTDVIIPARYCTAYTEVELAPHCLEDLDKEFVKNVRRGDLIVAGENFGCGSSRENAPIAIKGAGVSCVIAKSFARIFFRNSINIGLPIVVSEAAVDDCENGDEIEVDLSAGLVRNRTRRREYAIPPFSPTIQSIIDAGGMVAFTRNRLGITDAKPIPTGAAVGRPGERSTTPKE